MTYVQGFLTPVPLAGKDAYRDHAASALDLFKEFGATRLVETWSDDVPVGKLNDFHTAVERGDDEAVVFSWIEYPDEATYRAAVQRIMTDPRMAELDDLPFDGARMIYGGFEPIVDQGTRGEMGYTDGFLVPVPPANREAYRDKAEKAAVVFRDHGATRVVEAWGNDVEPGERTDFFRATHAEGDEAVVFSWVEWPSKEARDTGWKAIMEDERLKQSSEMPFDGKRMMYGGFQPLLDR